MSTALTYVDAAGLAYECTPFGEMVVGQRRDLVSVNFVYGLPSQLTARIELWDKSGGAGTFTVNETVTGGSSAAVGIIESITAPIRLRVLRGAFTSGETITGIGITTAESGATCVITKNAAVNGQVSVSESVVLVTAGTLAACAVALESKQYASYSAGHEMGAFFTAAFDAAGVSANSNQFVGVSTKGGSDGYFVGYKGTSFGFQVRKASAEVTFIPLSSANIDTLNGTGPSGLNMAALAPNLNVYHVKTGYLGVYGCLFCVEGTNGRLYPVHFYTRLNAGTVTTVLDPHFIVRAEITKTSGSSTPQLRCASWNGYTVGPAREESAPPRNSGFVGPIVSVTTGAERFLFSITNKLTFNGVNNHAPMRITAMSVGIDSNSTNGSVIRIRRNTPTTGTTQLDLDVLNSSGVSSVTGTGGFTGGEVIFTAQGGHAAGISHPPIPNNLWIMPGESVTVTAEATSTQNTRIGLSFEEGL